VHCLNLDDGCFQVGVHIADVTHFVRPGILSNSILFNHYFLPLGTALDRVASERSTSVYLCGQRIDMLPGLLSTDICSLKGKVERYAFSVIWILDSNAEIKSVRFCKSLIHSRAALTYQRAQELIDKPESAIDKIGISHPPAE